MSEVYTYAWESAERRCFEYLNKIIGTVDGITAFQFDNMPATLPSTLDDVLIWEFQINGGAVAVSRPDRTHVVDGAWHMEAMFRAVCFKDKWARYVGGILFDNLPATKDDMEHVARLYATQYPSRRRTVLRILGDADSGQEDRAIELTIPMMCAFYNAPQIR
jgi:hypothetical protein